MTISFHAMRANLFANATAASFGGLRLRRSMSQGDARPSQPTACLITAVAPDTSAARKVAGPRDDAEIDLVGRRMIPRRQSDPCRELTP